MTRILAILLLFALGACAAGGVRGPYIGGAVGGSAREDARPR